MPDTQVPIIYQVSPEANVGGGPITLASGLKCNDPTFDNGPRIMELTDELFPRGGTIELPGGCDFYHQSRINISTFTRDVIYRGRGGLSAGASAATRIIYNGPDNQNAWGCIGTTGCKWENLQMLYTANLSTVNFIDWSESAYNTMNDVLISGFGNQTALGLVGLNNAQLFRFNRVSAQGAQTGYRGKVTNVGSFSNVGTWTDCYFNNFTGMPVVNPGEAWTFINPTVEPLIGANAGHAAFAQCLGGFTTHAFNIYGGWFGDVKQPENIGWWLDLSGNGINTLGCQIGGGEAWLRAGANGPVEGLNISGHFDTVQHTVIATGAGNVHKNWFILPISAVNTGGLQMGAGVAMPDRSIIHNPGGDILNLGMIMSHAGPIADGSFGEVPPDMTAGYDTINNKHYIRSGGVWRSAQYV